MGDGMKLSFDEIVLKKDEMKVLDALAESPLLLDKEIQKASARILQLDLAETFTYIDGKVSTGIRITEGRGRSYLAYHQEKAKEKRRSFLRDLLFLILGGVIAAIWEKLPNILTIFGGNINL